jgi:hypothetical protein
MARLQISMADAFSDKLILNILQWRFNAMKPMPDGFKIVPGITS